VFEIGAPLAAAGIATLPIPGARIAAGLLAAGAAISASIHKKKEHRMNPSGSTHKLAKLASIVGHKYKFQHE